MPVTTTTGEGWQADLDYRLMQIAAELTQLAQGSPSVRVAFLDISPPSATLAITGVPTQTPVASVVVTPTNATLNPPTQVTNTGAITHMGFARTYFGKAPGTADLTWAEGAPQHRFMVCVNGPTPTIRSLNPLAKTFTYALHYCTEATGQEANDGVTSSWGTDAIQWAQANGRNVENLFIHAAVGQPNNISTIASIDTNGVVTLGLDPSTNRQQITQARTGVAASDAFQVGGTFSIANNSNAANNIATVTITSIISTTKLQTNLTGTPGTGGTIFKVGDGTLTLGNRIFYQDLTDWFWAANPGSQDSKDFQVFRMGQIVSPTVTGAFFDVHSDAKMRPASLEYGVTGGLTQYVADIITLFGLYRTAYPGSLYMPNIANRVTANDIAMAKAAGAAQQEVGLDIFGSLTFGTGEVLATTVQLLAAGVVINLGLVPQFNATEPQAGASGLSAAFRNGGGHNYGSPDARAMMTGYAHAFLVVDQRTPAQIAAGAPKLLNIDPANQFWDTFPLSARWLQGFENALGEPTDEFGPIALWASGTDGAGQAAHVYVRTFTADGSETSPTTAIVMVRRNENGAAVYDATSAFTALMPGQVGPGQTFGMLKEDGTVSGAFVPGDPVELDMCDSAIFISNT